MGNDGCVFYFAMPHSEESYWSLQLHTGRNDFQSLPNMHFASLPLPIVRLLQDHSHPTCNFEYPRKFVERINSKSTTVHTPSPFSAT
jgi:hypothetical protein